MLTKTKIALVAGLVALTSTAALAQNFDPDPANRYPAYASPEGAAAPYLGVVDKRASQDVAARRAPRALQSAPVWLHQGRNAAAANGHNGYAGQQDPFEIDRNDRASSPYAGGVN
jgi:hypothetical protein